MFYITLGSVIFTIASFMYLIILIIKKNVLHDNVSDYKLKLVIAFSSLILFWLLSYSLNAVYERIGHPIIIDGIEQYSGTLGDLIGGTLNPILGLFGIIVGGLAFYAQYEANKQVQKQFKIQQFESQFFEMLRLHKENVNEISIARKVRLRQRFKKVQDQYIEIKGRKAFEEILIELEKCYEAAKMAFPNKDKEYWLNRAYSVFFFGINSDENGIKRSFYDEKKQKQIEKISETRFLNNIKVKFNSSSRYLDGYATFLAHFYRHLFQIVKFIAVQEEKLISYEEKRKYIRILRAQLSNPEQALLFYNWKSDFGSQWENKTNKFFTDYRMIHNIYDSLMLEDFNPEVEFEKQIREKTYRKEDGRDWDPLFEFEDWSKND